MASTSNPPFVFKYSGTDIKFHDVKVIYGDEVPSEKHIEKMQKMIRVRFEWVKKDMEDAKKWVTTGTTKLEGQKAIYYGEKKYKEITANFKEEDNEKVRIEYLGPNVDYDALAIKFLEKFAVIEGYHKNEFDITEEQFYRLMKSCLGKLNDYNRNPRKKNVSPDVLYYAFYKTFPLVGSQERMSYIFPKLVLHHGNPIDLNLEPWKKETKTYFSSHENHFRVCMPYKPEFRCGSSCCKEATFSEEAKRQIPNFNGKYYHIYLPKEEIFKERYVAFFDALFSAEHTETEPVDFCEIARKFATETNLTCEELYEYVLNRNGITYDMPPKAEKKPYEVRRREFDVARNEYYCELSKKIANAFPAKLEEEEADLDRKLTEEEKETFKEEHHRKMEHDDPLCKPCSHFGPCGPKQKNCSCKKWCDEQCGCDVNCSRRFSGCQCPPGSCKDDELTDRDGDGKLVACICDAEWRECVIGLCNGCTKKKNSGNGPPLKCGNRRFERGVDCLVEGRQSKISGTGGFLKERVVKGQCVGEYVGAHVSEAESARRDVLFRFGISYVYSLPFSLGCIDAAFYGNATRFINHDHDNPNCKTMCRLVKGKPRIAFIALMNMKAGTELVFDYGYDEEGRKDMFESNPADRAPQLPSDVSSAREKAETSTPRRIRGSTYLRPARACTKRKLTSGHLVGGEDKLEDENQKNEKDPEVQQPLPKRHRGESTTS